MTQKGRSADRTRRLVGGLTIALALAWSATAHLLWQVESREGSDRTPSVRWVLSALEPSAPPDRAPGQTSSGKSRESVSQPVAPDGEAPAPCQIRRLLASDVEVLAAFCAPLSAVEHTTVFHPDTQAPSTVWSADGPATPAVLREGSPEALPRPPPSPF